MLRQLIGQADNQLAELSSMAEAIQKMIRTVEQQRDRYQGTLTELEKAKEEGQ
jgi:methyl-accepting chemotaxis protein